MSTATQRVIQRKGLAIYISVYVSMRVCCDHLKAYLYKYNFTSHVPKDNQRLPSDECSRSTAYLLVLYCSWKPLATLQHTSKRRLILCRVSWHTVYRSFQSATSVSWYCIGIHNLIERTQTGYSAACFHWFPRPVVFAPFDQLAQPQSRRLMIAEKGPKGPRVYFSAKTS